MPVRELAQRISETKSIVARQLTSPFAVCMLVKWQPSASIILANVTISNYITHKQINKYITGLNYRQYTIH